MRILRRLQRRNKPCDNEMRVKHTLPDPHNAENVCKRFTETHGRISKKKRDILSLLSSYSNFLGRSIIKDPAILDYLLKSDYTGEQKSQDVFLGETVSINEHSTSDDELMSALRRFKYRELSRIVYRDIMGMGNFPQVMEELSDLASSILEAAYLFYARELEIKNSGRFVIMGMGKLGGRELNLSSDIDLVYFFKDAPDPDPLFKLAEKITKTLSAITEDGFLYRVDIALRPGGGKSPIAVSLEGALEHYFYWGETWERAALIKSRPVAGDRLLGEEFCREIEPFVYKKYLDFMSIEDLKDMKTKLDGLHKKADVKLGRGGIREIEFFVQALQLVNAHAVEALKEPGMLKTMRALLVNKIIDTDTYKSLYTSYLFLRRVEHNIQLVDEVQTHSLPRSRAGVGKLARMMGFGSAGEFEDAFSDHTGVVSRIYDGLFYEPASKIEEGVKDFWELADFLTEGNVDEDEALGKLRSLGFKHPEGALDLISVLLDPRRGGLTQKGRSYAKKVISAFLGKAISSSDPDNVLGNLERFASAVGWRTNIYAVLQENPEILELLSRLFSTSGYLSNFLIRHPEYLDILTIKGARIEYSSKQEMVDSLRVMLGEQSDYALKLDILRRFKNIETLKLCLKDLNKEVDHVIVGKYLSMAADAFLEVGLRVAGEAMGMSGKNISRMLVLGLGKLGGEELSYNSDLDIIFIYQGADHEQFSKLGQRLITVLSVPTIEGFAYKVDTRLRPSGRAGALVSSFDSFKAYQERSAMLWERQALIKARPSAGSVEFGSKVMDTVQRCVYERPLEEDCHVEIDRVRKRMEKELAKETDNKLNLKTGKGGIVDIEFVVQMLQLKYGREHPDVRNTNTLGALEALRSDGLIAQRDYDVLKDGLFFMRRMENLLRLLHDRSTSDLYRGDFHNLAIEMGISEGGEGLRDIYTLKTEEIRSVYDRYFN